MGCVQNGLEKCVDTQLSQAELRPFNPAIVGVRILVKKCSLDLVKGAHQTKVT